MKVKTLGSRENPAVLMIPGMFCTADMPEKVARFLEKDYFIILPTLDGHHAEDPEKYAAMMAKLISGSEKL
jgi:hypothetical protein